MPSPLKSPVATAWAPLVNRNGAAPDFERTFARDGFYTAKLPLEATDAVVVDNAFWSLFHHDGCGTTGDPTAATLSELGLALAAGSKTRHWLVMHIPPGIDVATTVSRTHRLAIIPFLRPGPRDGVLALIGDPARRVQLVVTGHVHRFGYRIIDRTGDDPVPLLISPAVSPIFGNAPSFLSADVGRDGIIRNLEEHSYGHHRWYDAGGLGSLGVNAFSGPALLDLQRRLRDDAELQRTFARLYVGGSPLNEITPGNWRFYWCGATAFATSPYRECLNRRGIGFLTGRGVAAAAGAAVAALVVFAIAVVVIVRRRRPA